MTPSVDLAALLHFAVTHHASDVHIQAGVPPRVRVGGVLREAQMPPVSAEQARDFISSIAPPRFRESLLDHLVAGLDFSFSAPNLSRFRCSAYQQLGLPGVSMRIIRNEIRSIADLHLPPVVGEIALSGHGLTLVTGATGSGKSTTLAAMLDLINQTRALKIITVEDPVEYLQPSKMSLIAQLEVGSDTPTFDKALRQALRQDPDVILVGELRDMETLRIALRAADTGHQVFSTVHSANAPQTVERVIGMFPQEEHKLLLTQLVGNLEAIISQRLVLARDGTLRPAVEILRGGPVPAKYILEGRAMELGEYLRTAGGGQQTFDQHLLAMFQQELISNAEALSNASNREALGMALRGIGGGAGGGGAPKPAPYGGNPANAQTRH